MLNPEEVRKLKLKLLIDILQTIWQTEPAQDDCKFGIVVKLPKKGDLRECSNYRGIMPKIVSAKQVLNRILLERMSKAVDPKLHQQAGFRSNRSCADQIASLRIIIEQSLEWKSPLYVTL